MHSEVRSEAVGRPEWSDVAPVDAVGAKFAAPLAARLVSRPRLTDRLEKGLGGPVTLLSAPAGWGKTLLVGSWLSMRPPDRPFVWITLAVADDDPRAFWRTVGTGLARAVGEPAAAALRGMDAVTVAELPGLVAGVLDATGPVLVVLDNLHELRSASVHEGLLHLIDRPPPGLHLVVTTREDPPWPLDRMRLTGGLCELRCPELAFRPLEVAMLLSAAGVALDADRLAELAERTEGWAAALRLAAVQLAGDGDAARFVAAFSGDDHSIAGFLLTEVLARAEPSARDFLGRICVLDLVCADLADAVTGGDDGAVRLGELEASNFFVHAVGRPGRWYHLHRLVADLLRAQLTEPRHRRDLYRRAAEWHRQQGMALEAVRYALRGGLWRFAADVAGVHLVPLAVGGRARELDVELSSTPRDTLWAYPELACALAAARVMQGRGDEVSDLVEVARAGLTDLPTRRAERIGTVLSLIDVGYARFTGDLEAALAACRRVPDDVRVLRGLGLVDWRVLRILTLSNLGTAEMWTGEDADAEKHLRTAIETERWGPTLLPHINAKAHLALMNYERGDLETAEVDALSTIDQATGAGWSRAVQAAPAHLALAGVHIDRGDLAEADESLRRVADVGDVAGEPHVQLAAAGLLAVRLAGAGEVEQALVGTREALRRSENQPIPPRLRDRLLLLVAELCCRRRDRRAAVAALAALHEPSSPEAVFATVRLHLLDGDPQRAERVLAGVAPRCRLVRLHVTHGLLSALVADAIGDIDLALDRIEDALLAAAPQRLRRPFLDVGTDLDRLLAARVERGSEVAPFAVDLAHRTRGQEPRPAAAALVEPLTTREQVVLRYLASALSNAEIAAELYVSVNTVKTHQRTVYRKLAAEGRRDAVRRARELQLL